MRASRTMLFLVLSAATAALSPSAALAVIVHAQDDDRTGLLTPPPDVVGQWAYNGSLVVISPNHIITTRHQGGGVNSSVFIGGVEYKVQQQYAHSSADIRVAKIVALDGSPANLGNYVSLYTATNENSQAFVIGGYGKTRGSDLQTKVGPDFITYGYNWAGASPAGPNWGRNSIIGSSVVTDTTFNFTTAILQAEFDGPQSPAYIPYEASLAEWDSGGGWFINNGGSWQVAGLSRGVERIGQTRFNDRFAPTLPNPDSLDAVRISTYADWIANTAMRSSLMLIPGDANASGMVNDDDLSLLLSNWGTGTTWATGDFTGNGTVNDDDLSILLSNWYTPTTGGSSSAGVVPEPAGLTLVALALLALRRRRQCPAALGMK